MGSDWEGVRLPSVRKPKGNFVFIRWLPVICISVDGKGFHCLCFYLFLWDRSMFLLRVRLLGVCLGVVSRYSLYVSAIETGSITCFAENDSHSSRMGGGIGGMQNLCLFVSAPNHVVRGKRMDKGEGDGDGDGGKEKRKERLQFARIIGMTMGFSRYGFLCLLFSLLPLLCLPVPLLLFLSLFHHLSWLWIFL